MGNTRIRFDADSGRDNGSEDTTVSAILQGAAEPIAQLVMAHGAGAGIEHPHMHSLAAALADAGISTFRFNFPYMEAGRRRTDGNPVCVRTFAAALTEANRRAPGLRTLLGGHSFGGRMGSHFAAECAPDIAGLVYFSFPLHPAKKPGIARATHLYGLPYPQLFLSGTRDDLAELDLLRATVGRMRHATLYEISTANHSFRVLKRRRESTEDVYQESARVLRGWLETS